MKNELIAAYSQYHAMGVMTANEVRAGLNLPALSDGDELSNPVTAASAAKQIADEPQETIEHLLLLMVLGVLTPDEFRAIFGLEALPHD